MSFVHPDASATPERLQSPYVSDHDGERLANDTEKQSGIVQQMTVPDLGPDERPSKTAPAADIQPSGPPPDGGKTAWLTVLGGWCMMFVSFGWMNTIGALQTYYEQEALAAYSSSSISWIGSTLIFFFFLGGSVFGKIFDSYGPRWMLYIGSFMHVFGLMMLSLGHEYYQFFLAQSICSALGASAIAFTSINATSTWFARKRAFALGLIMSGSALGGVIFPIMITELTTRIGFGWAIRAIAFVVLGFVLVGIPTIRSRLKHAPKRIDYMEFVRPFGETPFLLLALASFFFYFGNFVPINYIILQGQSEGMSASLAGYLLPILNAASVIGRTLPAYLGDKYGRYNAMIVVNLFSIAIVLGLWLPGYGAAPIILFAVLYGFSSGAYVGLVPALVAQISNIKEIGVRNGANYALLSVATLAGNPVGGALIGVDDGNYLYMKIFTGTVMVVGTAFFIASRVSKTGFVINIF